MIGMLGKPIHAEMRFGEWYWSEEASHKVKMYVLDDIWPEAGLIRLIGGLS